MEKGKKGKIKATELKDMRVSFVSVVDSPATGIPFKIIKNTEGVEINDSECFTGDIEQSVKLVADNKESKAVSENTGIKGLFENILNKFQTSTKGADNNNEDEDLEEFEKEVSNPMSETAKKILASLESLNNRMSKIEQSSETSETVKGDIVAMQKQSESLTGDDKVSMEKEIGLLQAVEMTKATVEAYQFKIDKLENGISAETDTVKKEALVSMLKDKQGILTIYQAKETEAVKALETFRKESGENPENTDNGQTATQKAQKPESKEDNGVLNKIADSIEKLSDRVDNMEKKRKPSNAIDFETFQKAQEMIMNSDIIDDPNDPNFWKGFPV